VAPENAASHVDQSAGLTPENTALLGEYAAHLEHSPLSGHSPRTYLGAIRAYLAWLQRADVDGDPLNDATAKDRAVRDYGVGALTSSVKASTFGVDPAVPYQEPCGVWTEARRSRDMPEAETAGIGMPGIR
jgi:hypothetical protein